MSAPASPVAVVTGAANGIGRATSLMLAAAGSRVVAVDRDAEALDRLVTDIRNGGGDASSRVADVTQSAEVQGFVRFALDAHGRIDQLFNNAGISGVMSPLIDYDEEVVDTVLAVNVRGVFLGLKHVLPVMHRQRSGSVVNMASVTGLVGQPDHAAYAASKHAVVGLTRVAGGESAPFGVRVNALAPGPIQTDLLARVEAMKSPNDPGTERSRLVESIPAHRYGTVDEVAAAACFLLGPGSAYVNGSVLAVDGGFTAMR